MDLLGVELERRPAPDRGPVDGVAVGRRPDARLLAAGEPVLAAERVEEGLVRGHTTSRTTSRIRSRSASDATLTIEGTIAWSIGTASIRSIWAMVRSVTMRGAVRPVAIPSRRSWAFAAMYAG